MAGLWIIGGRVRTGEPEAVAIQRAFRAETKVELELERFKPLPIMIRYQWSERQQEPQDTGSDNIAYNFAVELDERELTQAAAGLDPEEYDLQKGLKEYGKNELKRLLDDSMLHPAVWDLYNVVFGKE